MAAEITLFTRIDIVNNTPVMDTSSIYASKSATFTADRTGYARIYANGAPVAITIGGFTFTVPSGVVEYEKIVNAAVVTVA